MKVSKLFHWLYAILMFLPFGYLICNLIVCFFNPNVSTWDISDFYDNLNGVLYWWYNNNGVASTIYNVYVYLVNNIFGIFTIGSEYIGQIVCNLLTYWTCISIIWLVFDVFMYVPLLVHRWIDKAKIE